MGMRYKLLGRTGLRVSELCLGAMVFGDRRGGWDASKDEAARIVERFAEAGGNFVDAANRYARGESERTRDPHRRRRRPVAAGPGGGGQGLGPAAGGVLGDRHGEVFDPFGHRWALAQHLRDVPADEIRAAAAAMFGGEPA